MSKSRIFEKSEEDDYGGALQQALPVTELDSDEERELLSRVPQTAEEYLHLVRLESARLPEVPVAAGYEDKVAGFTINSEGGEEYENNEREEEEEGEEEEEEEEIGIFPSFRQETTLLADFDALRDEVEAASTSASHARGGKKTFDFRVLPTDLDVLAFDQNAVRRGVGLFEEKLSAEFLQEDVRTKGVWLASLLSKLELPLLPETASSIRSIALSLIEMRATMEEDNPLLVHINVMVSLSGVYFQQLGDDEY
mmetsp:Transcript_36201/g.94158  ORF Transcript_36201/g.94158 Transcript_36201/m.94158 type:complete len:253 (-) Transcript_36201:860-1618(-)